MIKPTKLFIFGFMFIFLFGFIIGLFFNNIMYGLIYGCGASILFTYLDVLNILAKYGIQEVFG